MGFPEEIKRIRQRCFLTQHDFAKEVQVSFATVNRWESGRSKPNFKTMKLINSFCETHGIDFDVSKQLTEEEQK